MNNTHPQRKISMEYVIIEIDFRNTMKEEMERKKKCDENIKCQYASAT